MRYKITPTVQEVLHRLDLLGFNTIQDACNAILTHNDYATRWDFDGNIEDIKTIDGWKAAVKVNNLTNPISNIF